MNSSLRHTTVGKTHTFHRLNLRHTALLERDSALYSHSWCYLHWSRRKTSSSGKKKGQWWQRTTETSKKNRLRETEIKKLTAEKEAYDKRIEARLHLLENLIRDKDEHAEDLKRQMQENMPSCFELASKIQDQGEAKQEIKRKMEILKQQKKNETAVIDAQEKVH